MGFFRKIVKLICVPVLIFAGVLLGPNTLPDTATFTEFHVAPTKCLGPALKENGLLNNAERLFEDEIKGPEGFEVIDGELYTTVHGGYVAKIYEDQIIPVIKFGQDCIGWWEESKCGRPLGIKAYGKNELIIADAYYGIFKYNLKTGKFTNLVNKSTIIDGKRPQIFNGVEVARDGSIFWTHSSSDFSLEDNIFTFLADGSGRLVKYDPITQKNVVLMKNLFFANGVVLSPEEDFLLVAETGHSRIHRYYLEGAKKFTSDIFIDGLPGTPDNLRQNGFGGFFVPLVVTRDEKTPAIFQVIAPFPTLRKFTARMLSYGELIFGKIHQLYPNYFTQRAIHYIGHLEMVSPILPVKTTILELDVNGNVLSSYHGTDGSVSAISDVIIHNGYMYLGSPVNNYLGRIKLSQLENNRPKKIEPAGWKVPPQTLPKPQTNALPGNTERHLPKPQSNTISMPAKQPSQPSSKPPPPSRPPPPSPPSSKPPPPPPSPPSQPSPSSRPPPPPSSRPPPSPPSQPSPSSKPPPPPSSRPPPSPPSQPSPSSRPPPSPPSQPSLSSRPPPPPASQPSPSSRPPPPPASQPSPSSRPPPPPASQPSPSSRSPPPSPSSKPPPPPPSSRPSPPPPPPSSRPSPPPPSSRPPPPPSPSTLPKHNTQQQQQQQQQPSTRPSAPPLSTSKNTEPSPAVPHQSLDNQHKKNTQN